MTQEIKKYDVIVVGAGLIGSAFALSLAKNTECKIAIVERAPAMSQNASSNQRVVALGNAATSVLTEVGVFDKLGTDYCHPYSRMFVWDENTDGELEFLAEDVGQESLGNIVDSAQCTLLLQQELGGVENIDTFYEFSATSINFGSSSNLANISSEKTSISGRLIVAADGNNSWVRNQAKIFAPTHAYEQNAIVTKIVTEKPHQDTAWQRFLSTGPLAFLPLTNNQSSIVWSADTQYANELMGMSDNEFCAALAGALEHRLGYVQLQAKRVAFPLKSQKAEHYFKRRLALIGDAAHCIHPLAGQGANLGFKDVIGLVSVLKQVKEESLGELSVLEKYQRSRKLDNQQTDSLMTALYRVYQNDTPMWLSARGLGMTWLSASTTIKQSLAKYAMGA